MWLQETASRRGARRRGRCFTVFAFLRKSVRHGVPNACVMGVRDAYIYFVKMNLRVTVLPFWSAMRMV